MNAGLPPLPFLVVVWIAATEGDDAEAAGVVDASMMAELVVSFTLLFPPLPPFPPALVDVLWAMVVFWNGGAVAKLLVVDLPPFPPRRVLVVDREASELVDPVPRTGSGGSRSVPETDAGSAPVTDPRWPHSARPGRRTSGAVTGPVSSVRGCQDRLPVGPQGRDLQY